MYYVMIVNTIKYILVLLHCISDIIPGGLEFTEYDKNNFGFNRGSRDFQIHIYLLSVFILIFKYLIVYWFMMNNIETLNMYNTVKLYTHRVILYF